MDDELLDLCKEVYKRTGWVHGGQTVSRNQSGVTKEWTATYTSDYLLEKLENFELKHFGDNWEAILYHDDTFTYASSDNPTKAIMKLIISLNKRGHLNNVATN